MSRKTTVAVLALTAFAALILQQAPAQDSASSKPTSPDKELTAYRLNFSVNELEDGKKVNSRQYSMNMNANNSNEVKIGTRVPVEVKQGEFQYIDVGTNIWCRLDDHNGQLALVARAELSNFALPDQAQGQSRPLIRQVKIDASTLVTLDKPMIVGSVDDPNSKRQFQLEVTAARLK